MSIPVSLRGDFKASQLRALARKTKDGPQARRLLALAAIYDGATRTEAARIGGVTLQIIGNGTKMIGRFVRQLGLKDVRLSPSHSWRHRIKTLGRKYGLAQDILNAITGHATKSVADSYGEFPIEALFREISKIPALEL
jgi:hypothetical protein